MHRTIYTTTDSNELLAFFKQEGNVQRYDGTQDTLRLDEEEFKVTNLRTDYSSKIMTQKGLAFNPMVSIAGDFSERQLEQLTNGLIGKRLDVAVIGDDGGVQHFFNRESEACYRRLRQHGPQVEDSKDHFQQRERESALA